MDMDSMSDDERIERFLKELSEAPEGELPWGYVIENYSEIAWGLEATGYVDLKSPPYDWEWTDADDSTWFITDQGRKLLEELNHASH